LQVPAEIGLDTSFVVHALLPAEPHHVSAVGFLDQLAKSGSSLVFNRLLELELREVVFRAPLIERFGREWRRRRHDGRSLRRASRLIRETMNAWQELLSAFDHLMVEPGEVFERIDEYMDSFGLASYDAIHAATVEYAGTGALAATDVGFASVPSSRLLLYVNQSRVAPCRAVRARGR
jgi:predicted nucleic acid-binding protein